jgi:hypothetical protein
MENNRDVELVNATVVAKVALKAQLRDILPHLRFASLAPHFRSLRCFSFSGSVVTVFSTGRVMVFSKTSGRARARLKSFISYLVRLGFVTRISRSNSLATAKISNIFGRLRLPFEKINLEDFRQRLPLATKAHYDVGAPRAVLRFQVLFQTDNVHVDVFHTGKCTLKAKSKKQILIVADYVLQMLRATI